MKNKLLIIQMFSSILLEVFPEKYGMFVLKITIFNFRSENKGF